MRHLIIYYAVFTVIQLKEKPIMTITTSVTSQPWLPVVAISGI